MICFTFNVFVQFSRYKVQTQIALNLLVGLSGLEPPTSRLSGVRSNQLSYRPVWWRYAGSNRRPPACKAGALPAELYPHILKIQVHGPSKLNND